MLALLGDSMDVSLALSHPSASLGCTTWRLRRPPTASEALHAVAAAEAFCARHARMRRRCRTATASTEAVSTSEATGTTGNCHRQLSYLPAFRLEKNAEHEGFPEGSSCTVTFEKTPAAPTTPGLALGGAGNAPLQGAGRRLTGEVDLKMDLSGPNVTPHNSP